MDNHLRDRITAATETPAERRVRREWAGTPTRNPAPMPVDRPDVNHWAREAAIFIAGALFIGAMVGLFL